MVLVEYKTTSFYDIYEDMIDYQIKLKLDGLY